MGLDHLVVISPDCGPAAATLAGALGSRARVNDPDQSGYRSAFVPLSDGTYVDFLTPDTEPTRRLVAAAPPGRCLGWVLGAADAHGLAVAHHLSLEGEPGLYWLAGWEESLRSGGLLPSFASYEPPMRPREDRGGPGWAPPVGSRAASLTFGGTGSDRERLEVFLASVGLAVDSAVDDIETIWREDLPPGLAEVQLTSTGGFATLS